MDRPAAVLVLNAPFRWTEALTRVVLDAPRCLACDGGANALASIGVRPDTVIGDLDSIAPETRRWVGEDRLVHVTDQETTDFEKALAWTSEPLIVLGALGGRLDHTVANLGALAREGRGLDLILLSETERVFATNRPLECPARPGETWSFWTFDPGVRLTLDGVRWPVDDAPLHVGRRPSISNQAASEMIRIQPSGGSVVACTRTAAPTFGPDPSSKPARP